MEYNSSLEEYSSIVADPIIMKVLENYDLISAFVGVDPLYVGTTPYSTSSS